MVKEYIGTVNKLEDIDKSKRYVGYYWMSNSNKPKKVVGTLENELPFTNAKETTNPYIVEANLYCNEGFSISVKNTGEKPIVTQIMVSKEDKGDGVSIKIENQDYIAHRLPGIEKVCFKQAWIAEPDENCEGMDVLQPAWRAFIGFEPKEKEN